MSDLREQFRDATVAAIKRHNNGIYVDCVKVADELLAEVNEQIALTYERCAAECPDGPCEGYYEVFAYEMAAKYREWAAEKRAEASRVKGGG